MEIDFFGYYRHGYHEHSESNHGAPSQKYFDDSVQCKYGPLMCVARRLLHPKGAPIRSPFDRRGETPKGSTFSAHGLAWRRRVRIFYACDSRPHQRVQFFGSEWSPHLSRGVSAPTRIRWSRQFARGPRLEAPFEQHVEGTPDQNCEPCVTRALKLEPCVARLDRPSKIRTLRCSRGVKSALGRWRPKKFFFDLKVFLGNRFF